MSQLRSSDHVIVVGAGLAGWRLAESLRREGYRGSVTVVGDEHHLPYDRPPLSKQVLAGKWTLERSALTTEAKVQELDVTLRLGTRVVSLDVGATTVELDDGTSLEGSHVALAIGSRARPLSFPSSGALATLRSRDDAERLDRELRSLPSESVVAVIGGGFVGAEVATSMKTRGLAPIVFEVTERPLIAVVGPEVAHWLHRLSADAGIEVRTNQRLLDVVTNAAGVELEVEGGASLRARAIVAAVGSTLDLDWLTSSGLTLDRGIVVDHDLQAAPHVAAIGDVARFPFSNAAGEELVRVEHWQIAVDHAAQLARHWSHPEAPRVVTVPYFWSDQYGKKIQMLGHPDPSDDVTLVAGSPEDARWLALYTRDDNVTGIVALNQPRGLMLAKVVVDHATTLGEALKNAPWSS